MERNYKKMVSYQIKRVIILEKLDQKYSTFIKPMKLDMRVYSDQHCLESIIRNFKCYRGKYFSDGTLRYLSREYPFPTIILEQLSPGKVNKILCFDQLDIPNDIIGPDKIPKEYCYPYIKDILYGYGILASNVLCNGYQIIIQLVPCHVKVVKSAAKRH